MAFHLKANEINYCQLLTQWFLTRNRGQSYPPDTFGCAYRPTFHETDTSTKQGRKVTANSRLFTQKSENMQRIDTDGDLLFISNTWIKSSGTLCTPLHK